MFNLSEKDFAAFYEAYQNVYASQEVDEAKDDSYLETDMNKRKANNEKAIGDMKKTKAHKDMVKAAGKHFEEVEHVDEARITASMGRGAKKYREDQEQAAFMARQKAHQEKMENDPEYHKAHMDKLKIHSRNEEYNEIDEATAMAKRGLNEPAIRQQIAKNTGGGQAADRATALADKQTYGQRGVDPKARQNLARKQRGDFRDTASSNPGLHGYAHKSNDPAVKAKQAARGAQRGALTPAERQKLNMGYELEGEMAEAWYSGRGTYRTTASGRSVRRDEDEDTDNAVSDRLQRQREAEAKRAAQSKMKAKGTVPTRNGKPVFEEVVEYLYVEGYADSIKAAELMAENIGSEWEEMILEDVDWNKSEIGITGQPIPKKNLSAKNRYEFEKKRRENLKKEPGTPGDSPMTQALRKKAQDTGNYAN